MLEQLGKIYTRPEHRQAITLLSNPSEYPGLARMTTSDILLQFYVMPSFEPTVSWTLYRNRKGKSGYIVRRVSWDQIADVGEEVGEPTISGTDIPIEAELVDDRLMELEGMLIPAFHLTHSASVDGITYGLRRETSSHLVEIAWWCPPTPICKPLTSWYHSFVELIEAHVPVH